MKSSILVVLLIWVQPALTEDLAKPFCLKKWTTGTTLNQRMYDHCVEELHESLAQVETFQKSHQGEAWFKDLVRQGCSERWTKDGFEQPEMVLYCYKQELESYNELKYQSRLASYSSGRAEACFKVWKSIPGTAFGKTEECYRKHTEAPNYALPKTLLLLFGSGPATETAGPPEKHSTVD